MLKHNTEPEILANFCYTASWGRLYGDQTLTTCTTGCLSYECQLFEVFVVFFVEFICILLWPILLLLRHFIGCILHLNTTTTAAKYERGNHS